MVIQSNRSGRGAIARRLATFAGCLLVALMTAPFAAAAPTAPVDLGSASTYAVLSGASIGNTVSAVGAPHTILRGDLGVAVNSQPTGFPPGTVTGTSNVGNTAAMQAQTDAVTAYGEIAGRTGGASLAGALAGTTITPGLYTITGAVSNTTTVTLDGGGDPNAVFVFQVDGALAVAAGSHVVLTNGARASHVFWQVNGAGSVGANASFAGTMIAHDAVAIGNGSLVNGRAFALTGALTLDDDDVYSAPPAIAITGGATATTTDTTPTISGTTDLAAPGIVTVTIDGQTLVATPSGGSWSVTSAILANGSYPVVASVVDGAGNPGSASQQLTVDTVPPLIALACGPTMLTNSPRPTIAGTSDVAPGTAVSVSIGSSTWTASVQAGGTWSVLSDALGDGTWAVTASVSDPAGNVSSATCALTVDTVPPAVTINGGASALSSDATPTIAGTVVGAPGATVTVTLADATLLAVVQADGSWSVASAALADGPHRVSMGVSDAAGNRATLTQILTIDTVPPVVTITGGAVVTTSDHEPTLVGGSDAGPGALITISIAGQTITTLVQANGSWNATPTAIGDGTWDVVASASDPAGNVGRAGQSLTIAAGAVVVNSGSAAPVAPLPPSVVIVTPPAAGSPDAVTRAIVGRNATQRITGASIAIGTLVTAARDGGVFVRGHGTVRIRGVGHTIALTTREAICTAGRSIELTLPTAGGNARVRRAWKQIRAAVSAHEKVAATVTITVTDTAGNMRSVTRTVTLT